MKTNVGLWIDHRKVVVAAITDIGLTHKDLTMCSGGRANTSRR